jgi:hypothetical protein
LPQAGDQQRHFLQMEGGGLDVSDARRLKALEDENAKLNKAASEAMPDKRHAQRCRFKKW